MNAGKEADRMNKPMTRLGCLLVALVLCLCLFTSAMAAQVDYTMAYKLYRQLASGSGFSGTLEVALSANEAAQGSALVTKKPFLIDWDYIFVCPTASAMPEHRLDATLMDGETAVTDARFQLLNGSLFAQSPLLGEEWVQVPVEQLLQPAGEEGSLSAQAAPDVESLLAASGMPSLIKLALPMLLRVQGFADEAQRERLEAVVEKMNLRMDLWIEGYRQNAELGRLEDGSAIVTVSYQVPPANIKAQASQLVLDLLSDEAARQSVADYVDAETAALLLNPEYQPYYFAAIDALPLSSDLTLTRTVDMRGDTVALHLSMPFYDAQGGPVTLRYDRERGEGDLPDTNTLTMESGNRITELSYLTYRSMTDVTVYQGTFRVTDQSAESFAVKPDEEARPLPDVAFTLSRQAVQTREDGDLNVYTDNWQLKLEPNPKGLAPDAFLPLDIQLESRFSSKTPQTSATKVSIHAKITGEDRPQVIDLNFEGETRRQWQVEEIPQNAANLLELSGEGLEALLANLLTEGGKAVSFFMDSTAVSETAPATEAQPEIAQEDAAAADPLPESDQPAQEAAQ